MGKNELILGIDLGTTTSEACVYRNDNPKMLRNESTNDITPSVLGIDPKTKMLEVGESAKSLGQSNPNDVLHEVKRYMNDDDVENIKLPLGNKKLSPTEASAEILKYIKKYSEESIGQEINKVVITVPANFSSKAREATKKAGEKAGFKVERIISEPTAAALAYCMENTAEEDFVKIMIYDLGGGTFDVSIGEFQKGVLEIKGGAGDMKLGGKDFDRLLSEYMFEEFQKEHGVDLREDVSASYRVMEKAEEVKKSLSAPNKKKVDATIPFIAAKGGKPIGLEVEVTREIFEGLISDLLNKTIEAMHKALKMAKMKTSDLDMILLVGGSTRIPMVKQIVENEMDQKPRYDIDADRAVSMGAAIQGAIISGDTDGVIMDVVTHGLGTSAISDIGGGQAAPNVYAEIIPPGSPSQKDFTEKFRTSYDNQDHVEVKVYQRQSGNNSMWVDDCIFLGKDTLSGIPPSPAGQEILNVTFCYDLNGVISVVGEIESTGDKVEFELGTSDEKITKPKEENADWESSSIADAFKHTIQIAEKRLKEHGENEELAKLLNEIKLKVAEEDKSSASSLDDKINDLIFELDN